MLEINRKQVLELFQFLSFSSSRSTLSCRRTYSFYRSQSSYRSNALISGNTSIGKRDSPVQNFLSKTENCFLTSDETFIFVSSSTSCQRHPGPPQILKVSQLVASLFWLFWPPSYPKKLGWKWSESIDLKSCDCFRISSSPGGNSNNFVLIAWFQQRKGQRK